MVEIATLIVLMFSKAAATSRDLRFSNSRNQSLAIAKMRALFFACSLPARIILESYPREDNIDRRYTAAR
jgi:hypothetical protein